MRKQIKIIRRSKKMSVNPTKTKRKMLVNLTRTKMRIKAKWKKERLT
jgi:hypothetical protein